MAELNEVLITEENTTTTIINDDTITTETEDVLEEGTDVEVSMDGSDTSDGLLSAGKLYETILRHPDYRVVEVSKMGSDYCHPLKYHFASKGGMHFQYDGASRQMHHEAMCEDIIDLNGPEKFDEERYDKPVYILQDMLPTDWEWDNVDIVKVKKITLDTGAKWIKLYPAE